MINKVHLSQVHQLKENVSDVDGMLKFNSAHLQGVHQVLDQEEASHLLQAAVDVGQTGVHVLAEGLGRNADVHIYQRSAEQEVAEGEEGVC